MSSDDGFFDRDFFSLFDLPQTFQLDENALAEQYRALQEQVHPDRYSGKSAIEQRLAMNASSRVNDAHTTLKKPLSRAAYLLSLHGLNVFSETDTVMPADFLEKQMEWSEALMELPKTDTTARQAIINEVEQAHAETLLSVTAALTAKDWQSAYDVVRQWRYLDKFLKDATR